MQQKAALSLSVVTLVLAATHKTCLGGLPAAVVQQKAALSLCQSSLWFSLRLSRLALEDYQPRSCNRRQLSLSVGRHSGSRCDSQDLPRRTSYQPWSCNSLFSLPRSKPKQTALRMQAEGGEPGPRDEAHLGLPEYHVREMTPQERMDDPAIFVVLSEEATLGRVLALRNSPIPIPQQGPPPGPLPNTSIVRNWVTTEVVQQTRAPPQDLQPTVTANPALSPRVLLFHHVSALGLRSQWGSERVYLPDNSSWLSGVQSIRYRSHHSSLCKVTRE